jgi:hypothetical protein
LDEVWGDSFTSSGSSPTPKQRKEKKKKVVDPICELYEMGNNNGYTENDLVSFANSYYEKHDKQEPQRERPTRNVAIYDNRNTYDVTDTDDVDYKRHVPHVKPQPASYPPKRYTDLADDDERDYEGKSGFAFIDLLLYIISGIILIFMMEQFVKIGLLLQ